MAMAAPAFALTGLSTKAVPFNAGRIQARSAVSAAAAPERLGQQVPLTSAANFGLPIVSAALACRRHARKSQRSAAGKKAKASRAALQAPWEPPRKKTVVITGASSGLGLAAAKELANSGEWYVIMACRNLAKAEAKAKEEDMSSEDIKMMQLDLSSIDSVKEFAKNFKALGRPLDSLVCNAAVYLPNADKLFGGGPQFSADGIELSFAVNYLGHFLLCQLLIDDLKGNLFKEPGRCVILGTVTASINEKDLGGQIPPLADVGNFEALEAGMKKPFTMVDGGDFIGAKAYKDSKLCCVMLMRELHKRFHAETGIAFTSLYPGCITDTGLFQNHYPLFRLVWPFVMKNVVNSYVSVPEAGARLAKCVADPAYGASGSYFSWEGASGTGGAGGKDAVDNTEPDFDYLMNYGSFRTLSVDEVKGIAGDNALCARLYDLSEKLLSETLVGEKLVGAE